jgi:hypothetical protein
MPRSLFHASAVVTLTLMTRTCSTCGGVADAPDDGMPAGWSFAIERGRARKATSRVTWLCVYCARLNIRAIEGKLSEEYWQ